MCDLRATKRRDDATRVATRKVEKIEGTAHVVRQEAVELHVGAGIRQVVELQKLAIELPLVAEDLHRLAAGG